MGPPEVKRVEMLKIVCMKWGTKFSPAYVNILHAAVLRHMAQPLEFICFCDDAIGLDRRITVRDLPGLGLPPEKMSKGGWQKLAMFKRGLFEPGDTIMVLDVDIMITGPLDPFIERFNAMGGLHILREWVAAPFKPFRKVLNYKQHGQSSVFMFKPADQYHLLENFVADTQGTYQKASNDQKYISWFAFEPHYLPESWTCSFKRHCLRLGPHNGIWPGVREPKGVNIVVFHGYPHPDDLVRDDQRRWGKRDKWGHGPVPWVKAYWQQGLSESRT